MSMTIMANLLANNAHRNLKVVGKKQSKASARLSSGFRINNAADDAAGLAISEKMRSQIRGLDMAVKNCEEGLGLVNVMDAGMSEIGGMMERQRELVIQAMNDTYTDDDKEQIQLEINQLTDEIAAIADKTEYNTIPLLKMGDSGVDTSYQEKSVLVGYDVHDYLDMTWPYFDRLDYAVEYTDAEGNVLSWPDVPIKTYSSVVDGLMPAGQTSVTMGTLDVGLGEEITLFFRSSSYHSVNGYPILRLIAPDGTILGEDGDVFSSVNMIHSVYPTLTTDVGSESSDLFGGVSYSINRRDRLEDATSNVMVISEYTFTSTDSTAVGQWTIEAYDPDATGYDPYGAYFYVYKTIPADVPPTPENPYALWIQSGPNEKQGMWVDRYDCRPMALGISNILVDPEEEAKRSLGDIDRAVNILNSNRAKAGAQYNRLEHTVESLLITSENLSDAESRIRNTDMAKEMMEYTKASVLQQSAIAMLTQAKQQPTSVLQLLRNP